VRPWFTERRLEWVRHALAADLLPAFIVVDGWVLRFSELGGPTSERVIVSLEGAQTPQLAPVLRDTSEVDFPGGFAPLAALEAVLDQLPTAAAVVTEGLRMVCANRRAHKLLAREDGLRIHREMILPERAGDAVALREAVGRAAVDEEDPADEAAKLVSIARRRPLPLDVLAVPFPGEGPESGAGPARVLLLIYDPAARLRIDDERVERLFRLTMTEAFVAARLAEGKSIADIAQMRRCSVSTVRTHVKRILQKTGAARQADLVRLILTSPTIRPT
jgi:DNA-binding CsgD family transcriptional regulator